MPFDDALLPSAVNNCQEEKSNTNGAVLSGRSWRARQVSIAWHALDGMGDSAARALPDRLRCASVNGLNQGGGHGPRRRQSGVRRGARARHAGFGIADVSGSCRVATTELQIDVGVRMKSVSERPRAARAGRLLASRFRRRQAARPARCGSRPVRWRSRRRSRRAPRMRSTTAWTTAARRAGIARITARPAPAPGRRDGCDLERACGDGGGIQRAGIGRLHHRHRRACAGDWRE